MNVQRVLDIALAEDGYLEKASLSELNDKATNAGDKNFTKYWAAMSPAMQGQPWCQCFVNWCFIQAYGESLAKKLLCVPDGWSYYTPTMANYFKNSGQWQKTAKKGDVIYFKNSSRIYHVGIVYKVEDGMVYTVEGNTSSGAAVVANGGAVCKKSYKATNSKIAGYGRPAYDSLGGEDEIEALCQVSSGANGLVVTATSLRIRETPGGTDTGKTYKAGECVQPLQKCFLNDAPWFQTKDGWISGRYLEGWVYQDSKWWYMLTGYDYISARVTEIDGSWYAFDASGWMLTPDRLTKDGQIL